MTGDQPLAPPNPTDWHRRPKGNQGPCMICGLPKSIRPGEHRAVDPAEGLKARWLKRSKSSTGWKTTPVGMETSSRISLTNKTRQLILQATSAIAHGKTIRETAACLQVSVRSLSNWKRHHSETWDFCMRQVAKNAREIKEIIASHSSGRKNGSDCQGGDCAGVRQGRPGRKGTCREAHLGRTNEPTADG